MSKPKQWKQGRELKHADAWQPGDEIGIGPFDTPAEMLADLHAYPQEAEPDGRLWVGSGDSQ